MHAHIHTHVHTHAYTHKLTYYKDLAHGILENGTCDLQGGLVAHGIDEVPWRVFSYPGGLFAFVSI